MTPKEFKIWADGFTAGRSTYTADEVQVLMDKLYSSVDGFCPSIQEFIAAYKPSGNQGPVLPGSVLYYAE